MEQGSSTVDAEMLRNLTAALREQETAAGEGRSLPPATDEHILRAMLGRPLLDRPAGQMTVRKAG